jgi:putative sterol carrier protein
LTTPVSPPEVFTAAWAEACARELNTRVSYREAAATWEGAIILELTTEREDGSREVFLDLWHGECRTARSASLSDVELASYVLRGSAGAWHQVLSGRVPPLFAIMAGRLQLVKGALGDLVPYSRAAGELVSAAIAIGGAFPEYLL